MKKKKLVFLLVVFALLIASVITAMYFSVDGEPLSNGVSAERRAENSDDEEENLPDSIDELLDKLDLDGVSGLINMLDSNSVAVFGFDDIIERVRASANGEYDTDIGGVISYIFSLFGADALEFVPMMLAVLAIVLAYSIINSIKGKFASESVGKVVYFATGTLCVCIIVGYFASVLALAVKYTASLKTQINAVAPVIITLMTAVGASSTAGVYTPSVALIGGGMTNAVTYVVFPALLMGLVFDVIGTVSTSVKLDKTAEFFRSGCKWFLGTAFFLFTAVLGVSGITASVRDGISTRAARFAVSKYVPVIGGYLSQGFDYIMAGNVLIKNALGSSAVVLIVLTAAPVITKLVMFTLMLRLTAAVAEPLGGDRFCGILTSIAKSSSMITVAVVAMTFLYIMFLSMTVCTGNIAL